MTSETDPTSAVVTQTVTVRRPRLLIVGIGGTIAMSRQASAVAVGAVPQLDSDALVEAVPELSDLADIHTVTLENLPSAHLGIETVLRIVRELEAKLDLFDGFVITTGTDTLEEIAYGIDVLWPHEVPIVVTGAMRNASMVGADGPSNLLASVQTALSKDACGLGCLVVFEDQIHAARFVSKRHTSLVSAFQSPGLGPLGWVIEGHAQIMLRPSSRVVLPERVVRPPGRVALVRLSLGDDCGLLGVLLAEQWQGVVVEALGAGHVPPAAAVEIERLIRAGLVVTFTSRTGAGAVLHSTYGFRGSESDLIRQGAWPAGMLSGAKARVLLSLLLATPGAQHRETTERLFRSMVS